MPLLADGPNEFANAFFPGTIQQTDDQIISSFQVNSIIIPAHWYINLKKDMTVLLYQHIGI